MNEELYIAKLHKGDESIFRALFEEYHTRLCYFATNLLPDTEVPEDVVQEAFLKFWQKRHDFYHPKAIKSFLYITVKNHCLNILKHQRIVHKYEQQADILKEELAGGIIESEVLANVHHALKKLPPGCRTVLQLSYFQNMQNKEIAHQLQVSINTVKTQKKRALHLLRKALNVPVLRIFILISRFL